MDGTRSIVSEVEAISQFRTSTVFSIEDPASLDSGCPEIKRRNSSMLQSIETRFAIFFFQTCVLSLATTPIAKAGRNTPSKRALRPAAIARDGLCPHSGRRRLPASPVGQCSGAFAGGRQASENPLVGSAVLAGGRPEASK